MQFGTVTLYGRTNVGKSTILNGSLGEPIAIVSNKPQTTREALLGVARHGEAQIAFLDTPGLHRPQTELGRRMNLTAEEAARNADLIVYVTDLGPMSARRGPLTPLPEDVAAIAAIAPDRKVLLVINKVDEVGDKARLLDLLQAFAALREFVAIIPMSARRANDIQRLLAEIVKHIPEGPALYPEDTLTDRPATYFAREFVREQILQRTRQEIPHAVAVTIDQVEERAEDMKIQATIHVEKPGQRRILVGSGAALLKEIGIAARARLGELLGKTVHLNLFVRVTPQWKNTPRQLAELGYDDSETAKDR